jgi:hypothetical protein
VGWATGISKRIQQLYVYVHGRGVRTEPEGACEEGEESKVLETLHVDRGLGHRYQQTMYKIHKTYVHRGGFVAGSEQACEEGRSPRS